MKYFYYRSLTREFELLKERTSFFPEDQLPSSALRKLISSSLRTILNRYLPKNVRVGYGHIINDNQISEEIDLLFYKSESRLWYQENHFVMVNPGDVLGISTVFPKVEDFHQLSTFLANIASVSDLTFGGENHDPQSFFDSPGNQNMDKARFTGMLVLNYQGKEKDHTILNELSVISRQDSSRIINHLTLGRDRFFNYQKEEASQKGNWEKYYFTESEDTGLVCFIGNILEHFSGLNSAPFPMWLEEKPDLNSDQNSLPVNYYNKVNGHHPDHISPEEVSKKDSLLVNSLFPSESNVVVSESLTRVEAQLEEKEETETEVEESSDKADEILVESESESENEVETVEKISAQIRPNIELVEVSALEQKIETSETSEDISEEKEVEITETIGREEHIEEKVTEVEEKVEIEEETKIEEEKVVEEENQISEKPEIETDRDEEIIQNKEEAPVEILEEKEKIETKAEDGKVIEAKENSEQDTIDSENIQEDVEESNTDDSPQNVEDTNTPDDQPAESAPSLIIPVKKPVSNSVRSHKRSKKKPGKANKELVLTEGNTILHHAILNSDFDEFAEILEKNIQLVETKNKNGDTPLHLAIENDLLDIAELLILHEADVNSRNYTYDAPLHSAVMVDSPELTELLIQNGAEVEVRNNRAHTALHKAAIHGCAQAARVLIENHADINSRMEKDMLPIHLAAWYGQGEMVELLIQAGADLDGVNSDGNSSLHFAAFNGQVKVIKILINHDADPTIVNKSGETYLQGLNEGYSGEMIKVLE